MDFDFFVGLANRSPELLGLSAFLLFLRSKASVWDKHVEECSKIPKGLIMDSLEDLHDIVGGIGQTQAQMAKDLNQLIGRQIERDKS